MEPQFIVVTPGFVPKLVDSRLPLFVSHSVPSVLGVGGVVTSGGHDLLKEPRGASGSSCVRRLAIFLLLAAHVLVVSIIERILNGVALKRVLFEQTGGEFH